MKIGLLASGNLGLKAINKIYSKYSLTCVFTDKNSATIIEFCSKHAIPVFIGNPRNGKSKEFYSKYNIDILLSVNYLFLIEQDLINWPKLYAINFHGSLLPKYRGRTPHVWAIINNENMTGITAHLIDGNCDEGDIVEQIELPIEYNDTGATVLQKFTEIYPKIIDSVIEKIENNSLTPIPQTKGQGCFFGKRTPDDGVIDWSWQKERIRNWIRAQAKPYPGAFTWFKNKKIVIHNVSCTNDYFDQEQINGQIIDLNPIKIKTSNGVLQVNDFEYENSVEFTKGDVWGK